MKIYVDIRKSQKQTGFDACIRLHGKRIKSFFPPRSTEETEFSALIQYYLTNGSAYHHPATRRSEDVLYKIRDKGIIRHNKSIEFTLPLREIATNAECNLHINRITIKKYLHTSTEILEASFKSCYSLSSFNIQKEIKDIKRKEVKKSSLTNSLGNGSSHDRYRFQNISQLNSKYQDQFHDSLQIYNTICQEQKRIDDQTFHQATTQTLEAFLRYFQSTIQCLADIENTDTHLNHIFNINGKHPQLPRGEVYGN